MGVGGAASLGVALLAGVLVGTAMGTAVGIAVGLGIVAVTALVLLGIGHSLRSRGIKAAAPGLVQLRPAPAALPASDPLVARLAALLHDGTPSDLREQLGELALAVQQLVDHRARNVAEAEEIDAVTAPVAELVRLVEGQVRAIAQIDAELQHLDEGKVVRALASAEARRDAPQASEKLLEGLDRLRALEDARARRFHRLLEASRLARRAVQLGLAVHDDQREHEHQVALALASLEQELDVSHH